MMVWRFIIIGWIGLFSIPTWAADENEIRTDRLMVGAFSKTQPEEQLPAAWELLAFPNIENQTHYKLVRHQDAVVVHAQSRAAAGGLIRYLKFDAFQYPWLTWRWKIEHVLQKGDVRTKQGDDYAARIYIAFEFESQKAGWWERLTHAIASGAAERALPGTVLSYIWANQAPVGTVVSNPYTEQAKMVVLQSGNTNAGQWITQRRNIVEDYQKAFGQPPPPAIGIAIMTDTDNTGESTSALYGDIVLMPHE